MNPTQPPLHDLLARYLDRQGGDGYWNSAGVMIRQSDATGSPYVANLMSGGEGLYASGRFVADEAGQYLGHPTTVLLEDGKTILCVYPKGHGRGAIVYKRSIDGGLTFARSPLRSQVPLAAVAFASTTSLVVGGPRGDEGLALRRSAPSKARRRGGRDARRRVDRRVRRAIRH